METGTGLAHNDIHSQQRANNQTVVEDQKQQ